VVDLLHTPERILHVSWSGDTHATYLVTIHIEGLDRTGLIADITAAFAEDKVPIMAAQMQTGKDRNFHATLSFEIPDPSFLRQIIKRLKTVRDVTEVRRVNA
jgi:GTP pyrophosphokinase